MEGGVEKASATFIIRDHDRQKFEARKQKMTDLVAQFNAKYGEGVVKLALNDQYYNIGR